MVILFLASACKDTVIPSNPERLAELRKHYDVKVKECSDNTLRLGVFMENKLKVPEDLWNKDALLEIAYLFPDGTFTIVFHSELSREDRKSVV